MEADRGNGLDRERWIAEDEGDGDKETSKATTWVLWPAGLICFLRKARMAALEYMMQHILSVVKSKEWEDVIGQDGIHQPASNKTYQGNRREFAGSKGINANEKAIS